MTIKKQFEGMSPHRYEREPLEKRFAEAWQKINDTDRPGLTKPTLHYLMDKDNRGEPSPPLTEREWVVANTVIQWLGSSVGQHFLSDTLVADEGKPFMEKLVTIMEERDTDDS